MNHWNPDGCTLFPIVRDLIERAFFATCQRDQKGYAVLWMPDLPLGPGQMVVFHDCTKVPAKCFKKGKVPVKSEGTMYVHGEVFAMSIVPEAGHPIYVATCDNCKVVFFSSAWDKADTLENYVKRLKCGGKT